jgi:hypothetical protein
MTIPGCLPPVGPTCFQRLWKVDFSPNTTTPVLSLFPLTIIPEIASAQPAFPNSTFPFPQHYQLLLAHVTFLTDSTSSFILFQRVLNLWLFVHISYERKAEKTLLTLFLFCLYWFYFSSLSPRHWHLIRTFGSSGSSVLTQGYRTERHQVHIASLCFVPLCFQWIEASRTSPEEQTEV